MNTLTLFRIKFAKTIICLKMVDKTIYSSVLTYADKRDNGAVDMNFFSPKDT